MTVEITPRGASFAKACPQQVQLDVLLPCEPLPDSPFLQKLIRAGDEYEGETVAHAFEDLEGVTVIDAEDLDAREWHTRNALSSGARIIAGGRLPVDVEAHRVGEPDLLVCHAGGYVPVDVKSHKSLEGVRKPGTGTALVSAITEPFVETAETDHEHSPRKHLGDLMQLAHYRRLLERAGFASPESNVGGICGSEGVVVWYDLDAPWLEPPEYLADPPAGPLSAMARYDLEFAHRLGVHLAAEAHLDDSAVPLLAEPIVCSQCDMCRWREWCGDRLDEAADLSLISGVGVGRRRLFRAVGIKDLRDLADLDWTTAALLQDKVDLVDLLAQSKGLSGSTPLAQLIPNRKKQIEALAAHGFATVADLASVDQRTLDIHSAGASNLATQIDLARARVGTAPAYRKRGVDHVVVPRADIEVDVDMENTHDGCYLWGVLVTDRRIADPAADSAADAVSAAVPVAEYISFATWEPDLGAGELVAFKEFWSWLTEQRAQAAAEGSTFRAYCYSKGAEQAQMTRLADALGLPRRGGRIPCVGRVGRPARGRPGAARHRPQHGPQGGGAAGRLRLAH